VVRKIVHLRWKKRLGPVQIAEPAHQLLGGGTGRRDPRGAGVAEFVRPDRRQPDGVGGATEARVPVVAGEVAAGTGGEQEGV
jgi:hypothetical protein